MSILEVNHIKKVYKTRMGADEVIALRDVHFSVEPGEFVAIMGESGSGKTTLLNIIGGMDRCDSGSIVLDGENISGYNERQLTEYRRNDVGFVFQFYNLVQNLTALENVELAAEICKNSLSAEETLCHVGLKNRMHNFPAQLSGGEQQLVSIARAIAKNPKILLCDEPTGALDYNTGKQILSLLHGICRSDGKTVIVITHNSAITAIADRVVTVRNGRIESCVTDTAPIPPEELEW